jgi:WhiB family transcriptional regulator, redox-sensing transcriptional regulator
VIQRHEWRVRHIGNQSADLLPTLPAPEPWMYDGLCAQVDPDLWYPDKGGSTGDAKRICAGCPVKFECLEYALDHAERHGVWGGLSERQRRKLLAPQVLPEAS